MSRDYSIPVVFEHDGQLLIRWPDPRPRSVQISAELFESLIDQLNEARAVIDGTESVDR